MLIRLQDMPTWERDGALSAFSLQGVGIDNDVLDENFETQMIGEVHCKQDLGVLIESYYREAT